MRTALLAVDMQQGDFNRTPRYDAERLVSRLNSLAARIRSSGGIVIYVQHDGPPGDLHHPDEPGWQLLPDLTPQEDDLFVRKTCCDAFLNTGLDNLLKAHGVGQVIVTGCATDFCVDTTVRSAMAYGYPTIVPTDGHTTADRPYLSAIKIIEHHNAVWCEFISPVGPASLMPCADIGVSA
jgi:nicotinamidase-related amidase